MPELPGKITYKWAAPDGGDPITLTVDATSTKPGAEGFEDFAKKWNFYLSNLGDPMETIEPDVKLNKVEKGLFKAAEGVLQNPFKQQHILPWEKESKVSPEGKVSAQDYRTFTTAGLGVPAGIGGYGLGLLGAPSTGGLSLGIPLLTSAIATGAAQEGARELQKGKGIRPDPMRGHEAAILDAVMGGGGAMAPAARSSAARGILGGGPRGIGRNMLAEAVDSPKLRADLADAAARHGRLQAAGLDQPSIPQIFEYIGKSAKLQQLNLELPWMNKATTKWTSAGQRGINDRFMEDVGSITRGEAGKAVGRVLPLGVDSWQGLGRAAMRDAFGLLPQGPKTLVDPGPVIDTLSKLPSLNDEVIERLAGTRHGRLFTAFMEKYGTPASYPQYTSPVLGGVAPGAQRFKQAPIEEVEELRHAIGKLFKGRAGKEMEESIIQEELDKVYAAFKQVQRTPFEAVDAVDPTQRAVASLENASDFWRENMRADINFTYKYMNAIDPADVFNKLNTAQGSGRFLEEVRTIKDRVYGAGAEDADEIWNHFQRSLIYEKGTEGGIFSPQKFHKFISDLRPTERDALFGNMGPMIDKYMEAAKVWFPQGGASGPLFVQQQFERPITFGHQALTKLTGAGTTTAAAGGAAFLAGPIPAILTGAAFIASPKLWAASVTNEKFLRWSLETMSKPAKDLGAQLGILAGIAMNSNDQSERQMINEYIDNINKVLIGMEKSKQGGGGGGPSLLAPPAGGQAGATGLIR